MNDYEWHGWDEGEHDCEPPEPGKRWLTITENGEELAVIVHRLTGRDDERQMNRKKSDAMRIVTALRLLDSAQS